jgi:hypothetical protein
MDTKSSGAAGAAPDTFLKFGRAQTEATLGMQKELLEAYEQASRAWLARVHSEIELWSDLANKLAATRSIPDALGAYQESVSQRVQIAADDGRRIAGECQQIMDKITRSLTKGWPSGST